MSVNRTVTKILKGYPDDISKDVLTGIAEALWILAYASYAEESDDDDIDRPGQGGDWFKLYEDGEMPETPPAAYQAANVIGTAIESLNRMPLAELAWKARGVATGSARTEDWGKFAHRVGHALAFETLNTGSQWDDNHPPFPHVVPAYFEAHFDGRYLEWSPRDEGDAIRGPGRDMGGRRNPAKKQWYVVRVDRDDRDTHAAETLADALELANADEGSVVEFGVVEADDGGMARLLRPARWMKVNPAAFTKKGERMYKAVERGYRAAGDARASEVAARTVLSAARHGQKGLVRNPLASEWYEVVRQGGDGTVIGHVQATWLGDAAEKAEAEFGVGVVPFVASKEKGITPIGGKMWTGSRAGR
jgi:hypothetical protein